MYVVVVYSNVVLTTRGILDMLQVWLFSFNLVLYNLFLSSNTVLLLLLNSSNLFWSCEDLDVFK